jgi:TRAP-type C4-dicarboxylate transport system substrate-binding protein
LGAYWAPKALKEEGIMKKSIIAALFAAAAVPVSVAHAETFRITIGAGHPVPAASWVAPMQSFLQVEVKKRVEQKTPHKIEWVEAYGGSVAKLGEVLEAIENGLLDIGDVHVPFEPSKMLAYNFGYFVPFGTENAVQAGMAARKVFDAYPQLNANLEKRFNQPQLVLEGLRRAQPGTSSAGFNDHRSPPQSLSTSTGFDSRPIC